VQHIAFEVENMEALLAAKERLEKAGLDVLGPTDHTLFQSIYFFDPNGHRIELACDTTKPGMLEELKRVAPDMINEWAVTKKAPKHAEWLHNGEGFPGQPAS
jgi:catechol-2,3-dioxygenase